mgnify:CR=1 FL=1
MRTTDDSPKDAAHDDATVQDTESTALLLPPCGVGAGGNAPPSTVTAPTQELTHVIVDSPSQPTKGAKRARAVEKHMRFMERIDRKVQANATEVLAAALRAPEIGPHSPKPEGWTAKEYRIAKDARRSKREAPEYLNIAQRTFETFKRKEMMAERQPAPVLNVETIQVAVSNTYNYEVLQVEGEK